MRKTETTKTSSKLWLNITLKQGKMQAQFGLPLDYFVKNGNPKQKKFVEALARHEAGIIELDAESGWKVKASANILGDVEEDEGDFTF